MTNKNLSGHQRFVSNKGCYLILDNGQFWPSGHL